MCLSVWLTYFPHGPSGNQTEWPLQTLPRHPPFPESRKRWRKLNHKNVMPFPLYSTYNMHCNTYIMSLSHGSYTPSLTHNGTPTYYKWMKPHKHKHTFNETKTEKEGKFLMALSSHWITILWGCLHFPPFKAFMILSTYSRGLHNVNMWEWDWRQFLDFICSLVWVGHECIWPQT